MTNELPEGLRAFIESDVALLPAGLSDADRERLVELLVERHDATRLDRLGSSPNKLLAKAARRALHVLRTRGAAPTQQPARVYRVEGPFAAPTPPSWASIVDGLGERILWYVDEDERGVEIYEVETSEERGLLSLTAVETSRKAWRDRVQEMQRNDRVLIGAISAVHARVLIERAYRRTREVGRALPESYNVHRRTLQTRDELLDQPHPLRAKLGAVEATDEELVRVLDAPELERFVPPPDTLEILDRAIGEVVTAESDPARRQVLFDDVVRKIADEILTPAVRARFADRLLELGLLASSRDPDIARVCLAAADRALADRTAHTHPTFVGMLRRLIPA